MFESDKIFKAGTINEICKIIQTENKGYHLKLQSNENVILFGDIDHVNDEITINNILDALKLKKLYLTILSTGLDGIPLEKFILSNGGGGNGPLKVGSNPEIANMNNKRLVISREPDKNLMFNCATIKEITGGDELNARLNHSNDTKVNLKLTFLLECNDKPKLNEVNDALSRRILDIPFKNRFVDKEIYDELTETEKKTTFLINSYYKTT
eukprot:gene11894-24919_t